MKSKSKTLHIQDVSVSVISLNDDDYICITDMAKAKQGDSRAADVIKTGFVLVQHLNLLVPGS